MDKSVTSASGFSFFFLLWLCTILPHKILVIITYRKFKFLFLNLLQIPDVRTGEDIIDAVVVDEEAVGSEGKGCGAKILYGKGALDRYLSQQQSKDLEVCN